MVILNSVQKIFSLVFVQTLLLGPRANSFQAFGFPAWPNSFSHCLSRVWLNVYDTSESLNFVHCCFSAQIFMEDISEAQEKISSNLEWSRWSVVVLDGLTEFHIWIPYVHIGLPQGLLCELTTHSSESVMICHGVFTTNFWTEFCLTTALTRPTIETYT